MHLYIYIQMKEHLSLRGNYLHITNYPLNLMKAK